MEVSIIIVHYNTPGLLRQTIKGIFRAKPALNFEVIVVDNNPRARLGQELKNEFPQVKYIESVANAGFASGQNLGVKNSTGRHILVFNPDIVLLEGALEKLVEYLNANPDIGIVGPELRNSDGTRQNSCFKFHTLQTPIYRRTFLSRFGFAKKALDDFIMSGCDHSEIHDADWLIGACFLMRRDVFEKVGGFDEAFFLYFEDTDLCRRVWLNGLRVVYFPHASVMHYHRREAARGGLLAQLMNRATRAQIKSAIKYFWKHRNNEVLRTRDNTHV